MNEFIEKLIGRLEKIKTDNFASAVLNEPYSMGICHTIEKSIEIVNQLAEEYNGGWIPCSERLPEEDVEVLVYIKDCEGNYYYDLTYFHIVWQTEIGGMYSSVIAWQPLPKPYNLKGE